jgi:hypothetical protein
MVMFDMNGKDEMSEEVEVEGQEHREWIHAIHAASKEQRT